MGMDLKDSVMGKWYNWLLGPTGGVSTGKFGNIDMQGLNPGGAILSGNYDWKKMFEGAKTGNSIGGSISPGWGNLIGGAVGGTLGGTFTGDPNNSRSGLAAASRGKADDVWGEGNSTWKVINTLFNIYGMKNLGKKEMATDNGHNALATLLGKMFGKSSLLSQGNSYGISDIK